MKKIPKKVIEFLKIFTKNGYNCYPVGGCTRDIIRGKNPKDFDFTTNAKPEEIIKFKEFKEHQIIPTGIKHGTISIIFQKEIYEVTTFRIDGEYTDLRRPNKIVFTDDLDKDLIRRDFTINAIAYDYKSKKFIDTNNGKKDIKKKIIRAIGIPKERFNEDALRIMRACRFAAQLNFAIEEKTFLAMKECAKNIEEVAKERIHDELVHMLKSENPVLGIEAMRKCGLLEILIPELAKGINFEQNQYHKYDVYNHNLNTLEGATKITENYIIRAAALFHDIGKVDTLGEKDGNRTFYNHEKLSENKTKQILSRLKFSNKEIEQITFLVREHMFHYEQNWKDSTIRRFISKIGSENIKPLLLLRQADNYGKDRVMKADPILKEFITRINSELEKDNAFTQKDLKINGKDLIQMGIPAGKNIGTILKFLLESVLDDPKQNEKKILEKIAKNYYDTNINI